MSVSGFDDRAQTTPAAIDWWPAVALFVLCWIVYWPTLGCGFVSDDQTYVIDNMALRSSQGLYDLWFKWGTVEQYYPLVHSTFWLEYHLWQLAPVGYHAVNVLLHAAAAVLAWRVLKRLAVPGAWWAAAIFVVHPVEVESVAWISERKNVLSCTLGLGAILAYLRFSPPNAQTADAHGPRREGWDYELALALYVGALLSKTVMVSVPAVLLVIQWWKSGRITRRDVALLAPFFAIGLALGGVTVWMERAVVGAEGAEWTMTAAERLLVAGRALWFYASKLVWPYPLVFFYPRWTVDTHDLSQYLYPLSALAVLVALFLARNRLGRGPLAAVLIFAGVLVPALGFFNVYPFRYSFVADHYQYHASIALFALAVAAVISAVRRWMPAHNAWLAATGAALVIVLAIMANVQTRTFFDDFTLNDHTVALNPQAWAAHYNLASCWQQRGQKERAEDEYRKTLNIIPRENWFQYGLTRALVFTGQVDEGISALSEALTHPMDENKQFDTYLHLGNLLVVQKRYEEAAANYRGALAIRPRDHRALLNLGMALSKQGDTIGAVESVREATQANPNYPEAFNALGKLLLAEGSTEDALDSLASAVRLRSKNAEYREDLAEGLIKAGKLAEAEGELRAAFALGANRARTHYLAGRLLEARGDVKGALVEFDAALTIEPGHAEAADAVRDLRDSLLRGGDAR